MEKVHRNCGGASHSDIRVHTCTSSGEKTEVHVLIRTVAFELILSRFNIFKFPCAHLHKSYKYKATG